MAPVVRVACSVSIPCILRLADSQSVLGEACRVHRCCAAVPPSLREVMKARLSRAVYGRFREALLSGAPTSEEDMKTIADAMFKWARERGAVAFAHWFFPMRGGSGGYGSMWVCLQV